MLELIQCLSVGHISDAVVQVSVCSSCSETKAAKSPKVVLHQQNPAILGGLFVSVGMSGFAQKKKQQQNTDRKTLVFANSSLKVARVHE